MNETLGETKQIAKRGRRAIISAEIISTIYDHVRLGVPMNHAASLAGISKSTMYNWLDIARNDIEKAGENDDLLDGNLYVDLLDTIAKAHAQFIADGIEEVKKDGPSAYKWLLAKHHREEFGEIPAPPVDLGLVKLQMVLPGLAEPEKLEEEPFLLNDGDSGARDV